MRDTTTVLLTGANGFLGQQLTRDLLDAGFRVLGTGKGPQRIDLPETEQAFAYADADITDDARMHSIVDAYRPSIVVHAAAMTQADECQQNTEACESVNVRATAQLLLSAEACAAYFLYVSTDFVFDGVQGNYTEEDDANPVNYYGFTKMQAEAIVQTSEIPFGIARTCLVYGNHPGGTRNNVVTWVKQSLHQQKPIKVVTDQWRTPTWVNDLSAGIVQMIRQRAGGIFHLSGEEKMSPYEMAVAVAKQYGFNSSLIEPVNAATFTQPAKRPPVTGFDISKAKSILGYRPHRFEEALSQMQRERP
ncbi:MAG: SDR family oxidoreductase [Bacteroidota bacterium]|nr:SDR family oxidoreductase [Bacteroidota bacterium]